MPRGMTKTLVAVLAVCSVTPALGGCGVSCNAVGRLNQLVVTLRGLPPKGDVTGTICIDGHCAAAQRAGVDSVETSTVPSEAKDVTVDVHLTAPVRIDLTGLHATVARSGGGVMSCDPTYYHGEATASVSAGA